MPLIFLFSAMKIALFSIPTLLVGLLVSSVLLLQDPEDTAQQENPKPNVVFILADDLGYGDLGFLGQPYIETPNIDRMAREGMFFTNHYSGLQKGLHLYQLRFYHRSKCDLW